MGVGYPEDLVICSMLGCDMFDCVYASRTARFGYALTKHGSIILSTFLLKIFSHLIYLFTLVAQP